VSDIDRLKRKLQDAVTRERTAFTRAKRAHTIYVKYFETRYKLQQQIFETETAAAKVASRLLGD